MIYLDHQFSFTDVCHFIGMVKLPHITYKSGLFKHLQQEVAEKVSIQT